MSRRKFCVSCGREDVELIGLLCPSCYAKRKDLIEVPSSVTIRTCRICGSKWISGKWVRIENLSIEDLVYNEIMRRAKMDDKLTEYQSDLQMSKDKNGKDVALISFSGKVANEVIHVQKLVYVNLEEALCDSCMKKRGRFYDAVVQLRTRNGSLNEKRVFFESFFSNEVINNLSDIKIGKEGVDYYFISRTVAKRLVSSIISMVKAEVKESFEGESLKNGKRTGKLVISLRL
ncbi:60S ribosomal export protein NMD3 [Sulfuracidifex metallicus]|uniref:NMD protein affecting ribosome stability and mRNA decay n=1 Tax=Sulfuracidifex metallicus DSM 6482 = JCM 9184 TaxID=523847 RepID=A0A6A9QM76_SULME|nr:60S ribosomal export protein NMD3 [Sulfuracidifex metallicus]MUN29249.1 NMD protein affecting ribosome stability and mRNA decay [Sulfuracidifex metallicus DSM 6482 = JCM 9184]WOE50233.1 60S ribosomal export protein NMD3 [Sulfuracidifex metallicus DSM 6482 = JCM 9184]